MKIMFYATPNSSGHHLSYFKALFNANKKGDNSAVLPEKCDEVSCKQYFIQDINWGTRNIIEYLKLMNRFYKIVKKENPNIIHIECGDNFYRFFGIGLYRLKKYNIIITFHHFKRGFIRDISTRRIFKLIKYGVVHTETIKEALNSMGIYNVKHIEYPKFYIEKDRNMQVEKLDFKKNGLVISALGGTRYDKGLDILLESLKFVNEPFHLLIAGKTETYSEKFINEKIKSYSDKVTLKLGYLSDEEFNKCLEISDIIVLPYRKVFDGASGPLGEGVWLRKTIIGPNHGSLGNIIKTNNLGYTFESENIMDLAKVINKALKSNFKYNDIAESYRKSLNQEKFINKYSEVYRNIINS